ncbi:hypothetical protein [Amycolatopsis sp. PS_44_ISF1]|uniref:hypothetical protein n=1 Tax=Amycolatopsis sp. PS_44_ISF1 TaxID=2974917 RepID=UPI0028DF4B5B|nr:hypothetical protein [Amycolatopsis sp. PS_44_ISF1]MDT8916192.1 hypothetical protein [Amycolatopsis sp. PS_44_ISF1]
MRYKVTVTPDGGEPARTFVEGAPALHNALVRAGVPAQRIKDAHPGDGAETHTVNAPGLPWHGNTVRWVGMGWAGFPRKAAVPTYRPPKPGKGVFAAKSGEPGAVIEANGHRFEVWEKSDRTGRVWATRPGSLRYFLVALDGHAYDEHGGGESWHRGSSTSDKRS